MAADPPPPRTRSARLTLISLLLIPLLSLAALWGFTASITLGNVIRDQNYNKVVNAIAPSITPLGQTLQAELATTLIWLGTDRRSPQAQAELQAARGATDKYAPAASAAVRSVRGLLTTPQKARLDAFLADLAARGRIRSAVDSGKYSIVAAYNAYTAINTAELAYFHNSTPPGDPDLSLMTQAALAESVAQNSTSGAVALIGAALANRGIMTPPQRVLFAQVVGQQNLELNDTFTLANPALTAMFNLMFNTPAYHRLQAIESQVEASPANRPIPVDPTDFQATAQGVRTSVQTVGLRLGGVLASESAHLRNTLVTQLILAGGLGLLAVAASVFVMVRFGRRLRKELTNLFESARQMANERLPRLVERLRRGEDVDVEAESPPLAAGRIAEIANVAQAFSTVQRTAVQAAVGQADLRKGVNQVFVNLSLRNQSLLHRQLGMLDTMERATSDPAVLADLFRLDHLTTRMRRHAEGLLILAGATPGRGWRDPVPVADVLQAAIAEVEDYVRVDVITESTDAVAGTAVNDVIHLVAELVENATAFSPPNTRVEISGSAVGHGFAVEIEDRGLGMPPEQMAAINQRLASPPEFDLANSDQLGLFVAGQLAARHGIRVSLRPSPYGGTTAIVVLPREIIVPENEANSWFRSGGAPGELPLAGANGTNASGLSGTGPMGDRDRGPGFGVTGRHHRLGSLPDGDRSEWGEAGAGSPPGGTGARPALPPPAPPAPLAPAGRPEPSPGQPLAGSPMAAAAAAGWAMGSTGIGGPTETNGTTAASGGPNVPAGGGFGLDPLPANRTGTGTPNGNGTGTGTASKGTHLGLPRRVRQASLAPQLRGQAGAEASAAAPRQDPAPSARSPEQMSSALSALQDGWRRGRLDDLDHPDVGLDLFTPPGHATGAAAERNEHEGES
jgi:signal transduction histidine kinase